MNIWWAEGVGEGRGGEGASDILWSIVKIQATTAATTSTTSTAAIATAATTMLTATAIHTHACRTQTLWKYNNKRQKTAVR